MATIAVLAMVAVTLGGGCSGKTLETGRTSDASAPHVWEQDAAVEGANDGAPAREASVQDASDDAPVLDGSHTIPEWPAYHRPDDLQCVAPAAAGGCTAPNGIAVTCATDSQCADAGPNGRCIGNAGGPAGCHCTWDECQADADCPAGQLCVCHGSAYSYGGNRCMPGDCRVDADCGKDFENGLDCSPSRSTNSCGLVVGYYCHTPVDECANDSDCQSNDICMWSSASARWVCGGIDYFQCPV